VRDCPLGEDEQPNALATQGVCTVTTCADVNAHCVESAVGAAECVCSRGFNGNGLVCTPAHPGCV
jgi:hypothetical protein